MQPQLTPLRSHHDSIERGEGELTPGLSTSLLRTVIVGVRDRILHREVPARRVGTGVYELLAVATPDRDSREGSGSERCHEGPWGHGGHGERSHGGAIDWLDGARLDSCFAMPQEAMFAHARDNLRSRPLEFMVAGPVPNVRVYVLGGAVPIDTAAAVLELPVLFPDWPVDARGMLVSFPSRGTALFATLGPDPCTVLQRAGVLTPPLEPSLTRGLTQGPSPRPSAGPSSGPIPHPTSVPGSAWVDRWSSAQLLATWTAQAYGRRPHPASPEVYWMRAQHCTIVPRRIRGRRVELDPPPELAEILHRWRRQAANGQAR